MTLGPLPWPSVVGRTTLALLVALLPACRQPTSVTLVLSTDVACADHPTTSVTVSRSRDEQLAPAVVTSACQPDGYIGTLVVLPAEATDEGVNVRVVTSVGEGTTCQAPAYGQGCIVSRRQLRFIAHEELEMPVAQQADCVGVACEATTTCRKGQCVVAQINQDQCAKNPHECGGELRPDPPASAGAGGASGAGGVTAAGASGRGGASGAVSGGSGGSAGSAGSAGGGAGGVGGSGGSGGSTSSPLDSALSAGWDHTCALRSGALWCWGNNSYGQLGLGDTVDRLTPTAVTAPALAAVSVGRTFSLARVASDGSLLTWGHNDLGQLGLGDSVDRSTPSAVTTLGGTSELSAGYDHACAVDLSGRLFCWGDNAEGQLGQGDFFTIPSSTSPLAVGDASDWKRVSGGQGHTCGLRAGALWCWGRNTGGEMGIGSLDPGQARSPVQSGTDTSWASLDAGQDSNCALRSDRTLFCWGSSGGGDNGSTLGVALDASVTTETSPGAVGAGEFVEVSVDLFHGCALRADGSLWCWGRNTEGQLGFEDTTDLVVPTRVGTESDWLHVSAGRFHTCVQKTDGRVYCTGKNDRGQSGLGVTGEVHGLTLVLP